MSELAVVEIRNPSAFDLAPDAHDLFVRAFESDEIFDAEAMLEWVRGAIQDDNVGVFVARDGLEWVAMGLIDRTKEEDRLSGAAWVPMVYSEGRPFAILAIMRAIRDWVDEKGVKRIRALNRTGRSDAAYNRLLGKGYEAVVLGSVIEYRPQED